MSEILQKRFIKEGKFKMNDAHPRMGTKDCFQLYSVSLEQEGKEMMM